MSDMQGKVSYSYSMAIHLLLCYWKLFAKINADIGGEKNTLTDFFGHFGALETSCKQCMA